MRAAKIQSAPRGGNTSRGNPDNGSGRMPKGTKWYPSKGERNWPTEGDRARLCRRSDRVELLAISPARSAAGYLGFYERIVLRGDIVGIEIKRGFLRVWHELRAVSVVNDLDYCVEQSDFHRESWTTISKPRDTPRLLRGARHDGDS